MSNGRAAGRLADWAVLVFFGACFRAAVLLLSLKRRFSRKPHAQCD
jgi:hypothetical protein